MKCIKCGTDNDYSDRQDKKCKKCGHEFVFEPKYMSPKITDGLFAKIINDISLNNTIFYTQKQFDYYFNKKFAKNSPFQLGVASSVFVFFALSSLYFIGGIYLAIFYAIWLVRKSRFTQTSVQERSVIGKGLIIIGGIILITGGWILITLTGIQSFLIFLITTLSGITLIYFGVAALSNKELAFQEFTVKQSKLREWQDKWNSINNTPEKLLPPLTPNQNLIPNSELNHYSFDRLVVCQKDEIAHFLIANNFHLENNCAILSITGYPENTFQTILDMARQNPNLKVYALHDCSASGMNLVYNLQTRPNWFLNYQIQIYDLGLSYQQVMKMPNAFIKKDIDSQKRELPFEVRQNLSSEAIKWLESGYYVELESFSPKFLLKVVKQGITQTSQVELNQGEPSETWQESGVDYSTETAIIFSADSFG